MRDLARGAGDVSRGLAALREYPSLWKYLIMPAAISLAILGGVVLLFIHFIDPLIASVTGHLPHFLASFAGTLVDILVGAVMSVGGFFIFATLAGLVSGPFQEALSLHLEARLLGTKVPPFAIGQFVHELSVGAVHAFRRLIVAVSGTIAIVAVGLVPGFGTLAALAMGILFAGRATAYNCYDAVLARRHLAYRDKLAYLSEHRSRTFGLGIAVAGMMLVPGLNLIALGIGSAGATVAMTTAKTSRRATTSASRTSGSRT